MEQLDIYAIAVLGRYIPCHKQLKKKFVEVIDRILASKVVIAIFDLSDNNAVLLTYYREYSSTARKPTPNNCDPTWNLLE